MVLSLNRFDSMEVEKGTGEELWDVVVWLCDSICGIIRSRMVDVRTEVERVPLAADPLGPKFDFFSA